MTRGSRLLGAIVATLPAGARERYREEWLADLEGAPEHGVSPLEVLLGAIGVSVRIDRTDPANSGSSVADLAARRGRWGLALLAIGGLLAVSTWLTGGWAAPPLAQVALIAAAAVGVAGLWAAGSATALAVPGRRQRILILIIAPVALLIIAMSALSAVVLISMALSFAGVVAVALLPATRPRAVDRRGVLALAAGFAAATLAMTAIGIAHVLVWNPLAKVPGRTLEQIYATMAAAGESPGWAVIGIWAGGAVASAIALVLAATLPAKALRARATRRRIVGAGLVGIAGTGISVWVAGFGMGMGLADTFATGGGDAAPGGAALVLLGVLAGIPATLLTVAPPRRDAVRDTVA